jgi:hypothetical protein
LKNNYSSVKFNFDTSDNCIDTEEQFIGAFIGDYTKIGISTMINTGTHIGLGSNVIGGDFQNKFISPFSWGKNDKVDFNKFIKTCKIMYKRRNKDMSKEEINFLKELYDKSS